jgi:hypothetical protein
MADEFVLTFTRATESKLLAKIPDPSPTFPSVRGGSKISFFPP